MSDLTAFIEPFLKLSMISMIGLYFVFSNTVMKALKSMDNGAKVMIEINRVILNPVFMGFFIWSGIAAAWLAIVHEGTVSIAGGIFFLGTIVVTVLRNVPMNNELLASEHEPEKREVIWKKYLSKWLFWNHVRTITSLISGFLLML